MLCADEKVKKIINYGILISIVYSIGVLIYILICQGFDYSFLQLKYKNIIGIVTIFVGLISFILILSSKFYSNKVWNVYTLLFYEIILYTLALIIFGIVIVLK